MSTGWLIFTAVFIKTLLFTYARHRGWMRTPEQIGEDAREKKAVLRAFKEWSENASPEARADLRAKLLASSRRR